MYTSALWVDRQLSNTKFNRISTLLLYVFDRIGPFLREKPNQRNIPESLRHFH